MAKVKFLTKPVVVVGVHGEGDVGALVLNDGGFIERLHDFLSQQGISRGYPGGINSGGRFAGFFSADDAVKIEAWLLEQGAQRAQ